MTNKLKPDWAGEDLLSKFVNLLIQTKPIYKVMKSQARQVLIKTAEKNRVPWRQKYQELAGSGAKNILENMTNSQVEYPDYYQVPFHATEPWSDDYYTFDLEGAIKETGFEYKTTIASDPRHRTVIATKLDMV